MAVGLPNHEQEEHRAAALRRYGVLDTPAEPEFDRITLLAARLFRARGALLALVDIDRQWLKSTHGLSPALARRYLGLCEHNVRAGDLLVVEDAAADPRFAGDPRVTGEPPLRFYAGAPLRTADGHDIGVLAVVGEGARALSAVERDMLAHLAVMAMDELELRATAARLRHESGFEMPAFRETDMRLGFVTAQLPAVLWTTDRELRFTSGIGGAMATFGFESDRLTGVPLQALVGTDDSAHPALNAHHQALEGIGVSYQQGYQDHVYEARTEPLRDAGGAVVGVIGIAMDVSARARWEAEARDREERYRLIARATNDVVWDWNVATGEVVWSDAVHSVFRIDRDPGAAASMGRVSWREERIHPDDRDRVAAGLRGILSGGRGGDMWSDEYRFARGDGTFAVVFDRGFIKRDGEGRPVRMVSSMLDLTEHRAMEARLLHAERLVSLGTLAAGVAHEINNPLTFVISNVAFARERLAALGGAEGQGAELRDALAAAEEGAERVRRIVRDLRRYARADVPEAGAVDVGRALAWAVSVAGNEIRARARLTSTLAPLPPVRGTETRLGQVFVNLLVNAAQSIAEGRPDDNEVRVTTATDAAGWAVIAVRDTGSGIAPEVAGRLFEPFLTTKAPGVGLGLGLFVCHGIVEGMGGTLSVEGPPGGGTTFTVRLPPCAPPPPSSAEFAPAGAPAAAAGGPARVLVIDDEPQVLRTIQRALHDHAVDTASSGREALGRLETGRPFDLILCDLTMHDVSGIELYRRVLARWPAVAERFVFMTGGVFTEGARAFLDGLPNACIEKPFDMHMLRELAAARAGAAG